MDFNVLLDTGNGLLDKWETCLNNLTSFLCNDNHVKDKSVKTYLQLLKEGTFSENGRDATILWSLHGYLIPTNKIVKKDLTGKKSTVKFTIRDSQESFVFVGKSHQEIEDHLTHLKRKKE
ncbi:PREDICTED: uncharacterized protein LOC108782632, partial [Cyphomyrmex costatus]